MSFINKFKEMMGNNEDYAEDADYPMEEIMMMRRRTTMPPEKSPAPSATRW